ncbi:Diacylglycerol O-acyltransferase [Candidatus Magnetomorum sp. HK-1]|nr:Diacylglycerol O-acyltransferase [Candidatus Magnetomorum sp. HK-1]
MKKKVADTGNFWLTVETPNNLSVLTGLVELSSSIDIHTFRSLVEKRLLHLNSFRERIVEIKDKKKSYYWTEDKQFDIRTHVQSVRLKSPYDYTELQKLMSDIMSVPMDMSKPLWQFILVGKYQDGCAIIFRTHQCLMDRVDLIRVLRKLSDASENKAKKPRPNFVPPPKNKWTFFSETVLEKTRSCIDVTQKTASALLSSCLKPFTNPFYMIEKIRVGMGNTTDRFSEIARLLFMNADSDTVLKNDLGPNKYYAWSRSFSLKRIQLLAQATNSTINVIYISILTGAIKQYLKSRKNPIDYREIRAITPVDMRMNPGGYSGVIQFGLIPFDLPVHIDDTLLRISEVKRRIQNLDLLPDAASAFGFLANLGMSTQTFSQKIAIPFSKKSSLLMTNTQGPEQTMFINRIPVENIMFWLPRIGHIGLGTTILSYKQNVRLGIVCDNKQIPDPQPLIDAFEQQLARLIELVPQKTSFKNKMPRKLGPKPSQDRSKPIAVDNLSGEMVTLG